MYNHFRSLGPTQIPQTGFPATAFPGARFTGTGAFKTARKRSSAGFQSSQDLYGNPGNAAQRRQSGSLGGKPK
jgi:hypothetical protein